jgi:hypothetical protein
MPSRASDTSLENLGDHTDSLRIVVLESATGLLGEQPLV